MISMTPIPGRIRHDENDRRGSHPQDTRRKPARRTKLHKCLARLQRSKGASTAGLRKLTGWQAHSVRAALSGLRKKGHEVQRGKNAKGIMAYRITTEA